MRTIKFRAWDKKEKRMMKWIDSIIWGNTRIESVKQTTPLQGHARKIEDVELMQYTGLSDKNGKEIYEGDIFPCIYYFDGCKKHKLEVVFDEESAGFRLKNHGECHQPNVTKRISDMERQEIIGNIYSNPEFLQEKK